MILGIDASTYPEVLDHGGRYFSGNTPIDPLDAFRAGGVNYMRIRVWNDPVSPEGEPYKAGGCDLNNYLRLGAMAKEKGYRLLMDLHYSDFWADPAKQYPPKAWEGMGLEELEESVYAFTKHCLTAARDAGVAPEMIQVGNEITNGMLWPVGRLQQPDGARGNYDAFCRLVKAGCRACREVTPEAKIVLHLEKSNDKAVYQEFFSQMADHGVDYDIIGASYYPYWHGTPDELFDNLRQCRRFGKEIMVMELSYGFTTDAYLLHGEPKRLVIGRELADKTEIAARYPLTPEGQAAFLRDFLARARAESIGGVFYWEPLWLPGEGLCWASEAAQKYIREEGKSTENEWANQCLFDYEGRMLPGFLAYS